MRMVNQMKVWFLSFRALIYMAAFLFLWRWLALWARRFDPAVGVALPRWTPAIGVLVMAIGGAIVLLCIAWFVWRGRGTPAPFDAPREFVATGPYQYVRNPMYVGALIVLAGFALWQQSVSMLFFTLVAWLTAHLFVVVWEEPDLKRKFGESYLKYKRSVNRWLPRPAK